MPQFDVIIIGGGVVGCSIARELSRYKIKIALLEKEEELAFGVSKSNSGIIHPGTQNPPASLKGKLCVLGNKMTRKIARELGVDFKQTGELIVVFDKTEMPELFKLKKEGKKLGVPGLKIVNQKWIRKHEPNINPDVYAALYAPTAGIISPYRMVYDIAENAALNGAAIFTGQKVVAIGKRESFFEVKTEAGIYHSRFVINAAGLYADQIANMAGIFDFKISPRKGEEFLLDKKKCNLSSHLIFPLPSTTSKGILIIKTSDGNPMIGPTAEEVEDKENLETTEAGLKKVLEGARRLIPAINENDIIAYFAGLRPVSGSDFIIRHEDKVPGMITVAGIQSPGLTAAPAIALMAAKLLKKNGLKLVRKIIFFKHRQPTPHLFALQKQKIKKLIKKDQSFGDLVCRCEMVSAKEIREAVKRGAKTLDGIKFRTRAQAGRCHGSFCTARILKILSEELNIPVTEITKRGKGSEIIKHERT